MKTFQSLKGELLKNPEFKAEYDKLELRFTIAFQIYGARLSRGLTQTQLAKLVGTKQASIARAESGDYNPSIEFLERIAKALDVPLTLKLG